MRRYLAFFLGRRIIGHLDNGRAKHGKLEPWGTLNIWAPTPTAAFLLACKQANASGIQPGWTIPILTIVH